MGWFNGKSPLDGIALPPPTSWPQENVSALLDARIAALEARIDVLWAALVKVAADDDPIEGCAHSGDAKAALKEAGEIHLSSKASEDGDA